MIFLIERYKINNNNNKSYQISLKEVLFYKNPTLQIKLENYHGVHHFIIKYNYELFIYLYKLY